MIERGIEGASFFAPERRPLQLAGRRHDAHAKNYSILIGAGGRVRLAPLYDLASILPYDEFDPLKLKLAMKLGGKYRLRDISARNWEKLSEELRMDKKEVVRRVREMAGKLPVEARAIRKRLEESGIKHPVLDWLTERLSVHADKCERSFALGARYGISNFQSPDWKTPLFLR